MSANRVHVAMGLDILMLSVVECIQVYPELPDPMASNFGGDGTAAGSVYPRTIRKSSALKTLQLSM